MQIKVSKFSKGGVVENIRTLYQQECLLNEVVFNWEAISHQLSQEELIELLENEMREVINHLDDLASAKEKEVNLKKIEFLRISIMRAKLGRGLVSLVFPISN